MSYSETTYNYLKGRRAKWGLVRNKMNSHMRREQRFFKTSGMTQREKEICQKKDKRDSVKRVPQQTPTGVERWPE